MSNWRRRTQLARCAGQLRWRQWGLILLLMLLLFARGAASIPRLSLTADEPAFVGPGLAYLQTGDLRLETDAAHPPLLFVITAAPLLLQPAPEVTTLPGWAGADLSTFSRAFVTALGDHLDAATFAMRLPVLLLALLGAALVFRWAADWFGPWAGLLALTLFVFDPNILAHATLATTDLGLAVLCLLSATLLRRLHRQPSAALYLAAGLALGLAIGSKSSGIFAPLVLLPLFFIARLLREHPLPSSRAAGADRDPPSLRQVEKSPVCLRAALLRRHPSRHSERAEGATRLRRVEESPRLRAALRILLECIGLMGLALLALWALYRFEVRPVESFGDLPLPFATQWEIWLGTQSHLQGGHTAFLLGEIRDTGWWTYYPIAFLLKTPLPLLILLALALIRFLRAGPRRWWAEVFLWLFPSAYALVTLWSAVAIGYRFLLVVLPFLYIFVARLAASRTAHGVWHVALCALLFWLAVSTLFIAPHYLAYFNELAGGPYQGYHVLVDSNLDWGQSFKALRAYMDAEQIDWVYLSHYTYADPALYGVRYQPIAPMPGAPAVLPARFDPAPGVYVIGATTLQGVMVADPDTFDWFRHQEPVARPGVALFVYRVEERSEPPTWLAQCSVPVAPLTDEAAAEGFGRGDLRMTQFDCSSAWLYPEGGRSPGWYALFRDTANGDNVFLRTRLEEAPLSYEQRWTGVLPPFAIYAQDTPSAAPPFTPDTPIGVGYLTFLGYTVFSPGPTQPGQTVELETWWQVEGLPGRPLSIMMHLAGPGGLPLVVGDGLGVPVEQWQVGDIIIQRHRLVLPADAPAGLYTPTTGAYWLDTLERWPVTSGVHSGSDALILTPIAVQP